jgi:hypothetical protein
MKCLQPRKISHRHIACILSRSARPPSLSAPSIYDCLRISARIRIAKFHNTRPPGPPRIAEAPHLSFRELLGPRQSSIRVSFRNLPFCQKSEYDMRMVLRGTPNRICLNALVAVLLGIVLASRPSFGDDDTQAVVSAYKVFVPRFIATLKARGGTFATVENVDYDVKKTDSAINPLIGTLSFINGLDDQSISTGVYEKHSIEFSYSDSKWSVMKASFYLHSGPLGDGDSTDDAQDMSQVAAKAQAGPETQPS